MEYSIKKDIQGYQINMDGSFDLYTAFYFKKKIWPRIEKSPADLVLNFHKVTTIDSSGIGLLMNLYKSQKVAKRNFRVQGVSRELFKYLKSIKLIKAFKGNISQIGESVQA